MGGAREGEKLFWVREQGTRKGLAVYVVRSPSEVPGIARLGPDADCVHACETRTYPDLIASLEHWIARCTVWVREGS